LREALFQWERTKKTELHGGGKRSSGLILGSEGRWGLTGTINGRGRRWSASAGKALVCGLRRVFRITKERGNFGERKRFWYPHPLRRTSHQQSQHALIRKKNDRFSFTRGGRMKRIHQAQGNKPIRRVQKEWGGSSTSGGSRRINGKR